MVAKIHTIPSYLVPYIPCEFNLSKHSQGILIFGHVMSYYIKSYYVPGNIFAHCGQKFFMGEWTIGMFYDQVQFLFFIFFSMDALWNLSKWNVIQQIKKYGRTILSTLCLSTLFHFDKRERIRFLLCRIDYMMILMYWCCRNNTE